MMSKKGIKICKCCRKAFEPQFTDAEIASLWFTEKQLEMDQEHIEMTGHSHLQAPVQELCGKCSLDPDIETMYGPFGVKYRKRQKMKKLKVHSNNQLVTDGLVIHEGPLTMQEIVNLFTRETTEQKKDSVITPKKLNRKKRPWWRFWK